MIWNVKSLQLVTVLEQCKIAQVEHLRNEENIHSHVK